MPAESVNMRRQRVYAENSLASLEHWYAERGSRDMAYRKPLPALTLVCRCGEPARRLPGGAVACANHWPAIISLRVVS